MPGWNPTCLVCNIIGNQHHWASFRKLRTMQQQSPSQHSQLWSTWTRTHRFHHVTINLVGFDERRLDRGHYRNTYIYIWHQPQLYALLSQKNPSKIIIDSVWSTPNVGNFNCPENPWKFFPKAFHHQATFKDKTEAFNTSLGPTDGLFPWETADFHSFTKAAFWQKRGCLATFQWNQRGFIGIYKDL